MRYFEYKVEMTKDDIVHVYNVQIEPWGEYHIHPDAFDVVKDNIAELIATKANAQLFEQSDTYGVWFEKFANTFHGNVRMDKVLHVKSVNRKTKAIVATTTQNWDELKAKIDERIAQMA